MVEDKCKDCFAFQQDDIYGDMCISPVCIKEYDYDPETRMWTQKVKKREYSSKKIIEGTLFDLISDWESDYKIQEDLPAVANIFAHQIWLDLRAHGYKIIKEE